MKKVLVLGVAPVQMDALIVLKELDCETFACAMAKDGPGAEVADHFHIINILDIPKIIKHIRKYSIDVVYSVGSDIAMPVASQISEKLSLPHFVTSKTAILCNNKEMMRRALGSECEGNVPFQVIEDETILPKIKMPYILKPSDSQGQRGVFLIHSVEEYQENFRVAIRYSRSNKVMVERYIDGPELSINIYMIEGELRFFVVSDRETWPQFIGLIHKHIVPTKVMNKEMLNRLEKVIVDACHRLGIMNGPAYFQVKVENGKPYIIEMTPRLDGCHMWKLLSYHTGMNLLKLTFEHLLNQNISELDRENKKIFGHELEFFYQEPNTIMDKDKFNVPKDSLGHFFYYKSEDKIRSVNGKFEKVGYFIRSEVFKDFSKEM